MLELYCKNPECDCRRVIFHVISEREEKIVAVISFGWESEEFYKKWIEIDDESMIKELKGPTLNSASRQSEYAPELLELVRTVILTDINYVDRLKGHYKMFKEKIREESSLEDEFLQRYKPGRNDPCPCGSGKKYKKCCC